MDNAQHTPGPWVYGKTGYVKSGDCYIAEVLHGPDCPDADEVKANARLIAAAPDLLAALEKCVRELQRYENPQNIVTSLQLDALAAIAKAKGVQS